MKKKNPNAQDLLEKAAPFLGQKTKFQLAYPNVVSLDLKVTAIPLSFGTSESYEYSLQNPPGNFCPCPNQNCTGGGFDMGSFLHDLISKKQTTGEAKSACVGRERMNRTSRSCFYRFKATASIKYAEADGSPS